MIHQAASGLGKGEVDSSILSGSTTKTLKNHENQSQNVARPRREMTNNDRTFRAEAGKVGENPGSTDSAAAPKSETPETLAGVTGADCAGDLREASGAEDTFTRLGDAMPIRLGRLAREMIAALQAFRRQEDGAEGRLADALGDVLGAHELAFMRRAVASASTAAPPYGWTRAQWREAMAEAKAMAR